MLTIIRGIVTIIYIIICIVLSVIVLMQEGKQAGLTGALSGGVTETYWGKNKGRSAEGALEKGTRWLAIFFILISLVLNLNW